jgi:FCD domain
MGLYLDYRKVSGGGLIAVRRAIEMGIVTRVVERHDQAGVPEQLGAAWRWKDDDRDDAPDKADHYHTVLADLCGNPVLTFFLRIVTALWRRHTAESGTRRGRPRSSRSCRCAGGSPRRCSPATRGRRATGCAVTWLRSANVALTPPRSQRRPAPPSTRRACPVTHAAASLHR